MAPPRNRAQSYALYRPPYLGNGRLELFHMLLPLIRIKLKLSIRERRPSYGIIHES